MKPFKLFLPLCCFTLLTSLAGGVRPTRAAQDGDKYVYADFETMKDGRPVSNHGGQVQLNAYSENGANPSRFKGAAGTNAPEIVRPGKESPNKAAYFEYEFRIPNQYAGVGLEVMGEPYKDGKPVADDLSAYKYVTLQVYATTTNTVINALRFEIISRGQGLGTPDAFPQTTFKVSPGFNTYKIALKDLNQPDWATPKLSVKEVLKKLTSVTVSAYCGPCSPTSGKVLVDNIVFQK